MHIAMWSGPRNLSTAMMYAFGARSDFAVWDEPFYAPYLDLTGIDHPMRAETLAAHECAPNAVARLCVAPPPNGKAHYYQKHMCHHMVDGTPRGWMKEVTNVFLIRHPARVISSYAKKWENPTLDDIGFIAQEAMFNAYCEETGQTPLVIDSTDIRANPRDMLTKLCTSIGIPFDAGMLAWKAGPRAEDGAWAPHWYPEVWKSTGFAPPERELPAVPAHLEAVLEHALPAYERLAQYALK